MTPSVGGRADRGPARGRGPSEDDLPAVPTRRSRPDDAGDLSGIHTLLRDTHRAAVLLRECSALRRAFPALKHAGVSFARVRKGLPLPVLDVEQPDLRDRKSTRL